MDFGILVFQSKSHIEMFLDHASKLDTTGIEWEVLAENILLITKTQSVPPESWGQFKSAGFKSICNDWISTWHEEKELRDIHLNELVKNKYPFVEVFWGDNACIVSSDDDIQY